MTFVVYDLEPEEVVGCAQCMDEGVEGNYHIGQAFFGADANYICMKHLPEDAVLMKDHLDKHPSEHYPTPEVEK